MYVFQCYQFLDIAETTTRGGDCEHMISLDMHALNLKSDGTSHLQSAEDKNGNGM